jgi:hypothetical protein
MSTAFSPAQLRASLWAREGGRVHAVIDGLIVPGIAEKLKTVDEATPTYPGWGVLTVSGCALLQMREHCRSIGEVITPDGNRRPWRWYDPDVLRVALPTLLAGQLDEFFAADQAIVIAEPQAWTWLAMEQGVLATDMRPLMRAAS